MRLSRLFAFILACATAVNCPGCRHDEAGNRSAGAPRPNTPQGAFAELIAHNNRGVGLMGMFEYEKARAEFEQAAAIDALNADVQVNLAIATLNRQHEGDENRALAILDMVLQRDPSNVRAEYCEGLLRLYLQSPERAAPAFAKVADADAKDAFAAYYLGQCLAQQKQYDKGLEQYRRAIELDPQIRSAYYAASQASRALNKDDDAAKFLAQFQDLERNPQAHLAEFKYTRMGPKSMAQAIDVSPAQRTVTARPAGPIFLDAQPLLSNGDRFKWKTATIERPACVTAVDIDHDGDIDVFIADCLDQDDVHNAVCINDGTGRFTLDADHVLAKIPDVNAALWGDFDNDGSTDVYLCRRGPNMLWRFSKAAGKGQWLDITAKAGVSDGVFDSVDGAVFDADGDGDLDIFVVNANGPNELFNNNLDGTFRPIAAQAGIDGDGKGGRQVLPVDLDGDRDLDLIVINNQPPHDVWINDRAWTYRRADGFDIFRQTPAAGVLASDNDADGNVELMSLSNDWAKPRRIWRRDASWGGWTATVLTDPPDAQQSGPATTFWLPASGDAQPNLLVGDRAGCAVWSSTLAAGWVQALSLAGKTFTGWTPLVPDAGTGPSVVAALNGEPPLIWRPGPGRFPLASVSFSGRQVTSDNRQIRSNASGIGTRYAARFDSMWAAGNVLRTSSGPGQSLQPIVIGLAGHDRIDYISIDWSDGVFQSEIDLDVGKRHDIEETQRQLSSCPALFAWDGARYRFISDLLGVGGIGYMTAPGGYAPTRPWENLLLPRGACVPRDGQCILKLGEPMEEACYLDAARLVAYDLPPGWDMTMDDRMNVAGPEPTGLPIFYRGEALRPADRAANDRGEDVTAALSAADLTAAPVGEVDERFIGLLRKDQILTLGFAAGDRLSRKRQGAWLLIDGWIEYPYSQTMFAAWQAHAEYRAPSLDIRDARGQWRTVYDQFGYPAGMPRQMALPLPDDLVIDNEQPLELRIRTNMEVYFDRVLLVPAQDCPQARRTELPMTRATLADVGFPRRSTGPQRQPSYDYDQRAALWDTRHQGGWYSDFGRVDALVAHEDDAVAIFGPGEEVELRYDAANLPALESGWTRRFVLEARGWCKDMDLYTRDGETLGPLPTAQPPRDAATRDQLHQRLNTRYQGGR